MSAINYVFRSLLWATILCVTIWGISHGSNNTTGIILPPGFMTTTVINELDRPVDMVFLPSGDLFVLEKGSGDGSAGVADLFLFKGYELQDKPVLQLAVNPQEDQGALAIALHPDFAINGYFYISYILANTMLNNVGQQPTTTLRIARFQYDHANEAAVGNSERILMEIAVDHEVMRNHGGSLAFGTNGNLYIGIGDFDLEELNTPQLTDNRIGKIMRIRPTTDNNSPYYTIPANNPFMGNGAYLPEIYAIGTRNPYRMSTRQSDGLIAMGDVGRLDWEEVNKIQSGVNYGWPVREGPCHIGGRFPCLPAAASYSDPTLYYEHEWSQGTTGIRLGSIGGMTFYEGDLFPTDFQNNVIFADSTIGFMGVVNMQTGNYKRFAENLINPIDLEVHDDILFVLDGELGTIMSIRYTANNNQPSVSTLTVDNHMGSAPHTITFTAVASDPNNDALTYIYDFGDGAVMTTTNSVVQHSYLSDQTVTARLTVVDSLGAAALEQTETITVYSGALPSIVINNQSNPSTSTYHGGDLYGYNAVISTTAGLAANPFEWDILLRHGTHAYPKVVGYVGANNFFRIPTNNHQGEHEVWYEWVLSMKTDDGQVIRLSDTIFPDTMQMTIQTNPPNAPMLINGDLVTTTTTITTVVGIENHLVALPQTINDTTWLGTSWSSNNANEIGNNVQIQALVGDPVWTADYIPAASALYLPLLNR